MEIRQEDEETLKKDFQKTNLFGFAKGGSVQKIEQLDFDRVIKIFCKKRTQFGEGETFALIFELTGRNSNAVLVKQDDAILDCLKKIDASKNRFRQILPGKKYLPPPPFKKLNPFLVKREDFEKLLKKCKKPAPECLLSVFGGMDELLAQNIVIRSGMDLGRRANESSEEDLKQLWETFSRAFEGISHRDLAPQVVFDPNGDPKAISLIDLPFLPETQKLYYKSLNSAIISFFSLKLRREGERKQIHTLSKTISRALKKLKDRAKKIEEDLKEADRFEEYRRFGELLLMNKEKIKKGEASVRLTDVFDPDHQVVEIPLDPKFTALENAQIYFKRYSKAKEASSIAKKRGSEAADLIVHLEEISKRLEGSIGKSELEEIRLSLVKLGVVRKGTPKIKGKKGKGFSPRRFVTRSGWEILVGRNNRENDYLTFQFARPYDFWFHAQDVSGSHVVLRRKDKRSEPSSEEITEAAKLAAHFSKVRKEKKAAVLYTQVKYVRKPKGAKPGLVLVEKEKSILVEPGIPGEG